MTRVEMVKSRGVSFGLSVGCGTIGLLAVAARRPLIHFIGSSSSNLTGGLRFRRSRFCPIARGDGIGCRYSGGRILTGCFEMAHPQTPGGGV